MKKGMKVFLIAMTGVLFLLFLQQVLWGGLFFQSAPFSRKYPEPRPAPSEKPVIYLYPEMPTQVEVKLRLDGEILCTYPEYKDGWRVTAFPDGRLINHADGREYAYLFWEGIARQEWDFPDGFVVPGADTAEFLQDKLAYMGLSSEEYNEFIVYWLPRMEHNKYNLIRFAGEAYTSHAELMVIPEPDTIGRVFMVFQPLEQKVDLPEQILQPIERKGFVLIEWGGAEVTAAH